MEKAWPSNDREKERVSFVFRRETVRVILYLSAPGLLFLPSLFFIDRARSRFFSHSAIFSAIFLANYPTRFPSKNLFSSLSTFHPHFPVFSSFLFFFLSLFLYCKRRCINIGERLDAFRKCFLLVDSREPRVRGTPYEIFKPPVFPSLCSFMGNSGVSVCSNLPRGD